MGIGEVRELAEEGRQHGVKVAARSGVDASGDEGRAVLGQPDVALDLLHDLERHLAGGAAARPEKDGQGRRLLPDPPEDPLGLRECLVARRREPPAEHDAGQRGVRLDGGFGIVQRVGEHDAAPERFERRLDLLRAARDRQILLGTASDDEHRKTGS